MAMWIIRPESHWPLAVMLVATQISVGVLIVERVLSLLAGNAWDASVTPMDNIARFRRWRPRDWASRHCTSVNRCELGVSSWDCAPVGSAAKRSFLANTWVCWVPVWRLRGRLCGSPMHPESLVSLIPSWASAAALWLAVPIGLAGLYASAMIYIATRRQLWRMPRTLTRFFGTTLVGGLVGVADGRHINLVTANRRRTVLGRPRSRWR